MTKAKKSGKANFILLLQCTMTTASVREVVFTEELGFSFQYNESSNLILTDTGMCLQWHKKKSQKRKKEEKKQTNK